MAPSRDDYALAFDAARDAMLVVRAGRIIGANRAALALLDIPREELLGLSLVGELVPLDEGPTFDRLAASGGPTSTLLLDRRGDALPVEASLHRHDGCAVYVFRPQRGEASDSGYQRLVELLPDGLATLDPRGHIAFCNHSFARMLGHRSRHPLVGKALVEWVRSEDVERVRTGLSRWAEGQPDRFQVSLRSLDDERVPVLLSGRALPAEPGDEGGVVILVTDFAEREALTERLAVARQMDALSRLAGGIAHDFNNLLTGILGNASRIADIADDTRVHRLTEAVEDSAELAARLTRRLLTLVRGQSPHRRLIDVSELVEQTLRMLDKVMPDSVEVRTEFTPALPPVLADESQLQQAVLNLCINGRDALVEHRGGGRLELRVRPGVLAKPLDDGSYTDEPAVELVVCDDGPGIPKKLRTRVFDPFFTTKGLGRGSGLGLATVYQLVEAHGGTVDIDDAEGGGARITLRLPARPGARAEEVPRASRSSTSGDLPPVGARILLAEDEDAIRKLVQEALRAQGYEVVSAHDGEQAIALWEAHRGNIDLLLLDVRMPGAEGPDVLRHARLQRPEVPAIFSSGFIPSEHEDEPVFERVLFLPKPYRVPELVEVVRAGLRMAAGHSPDATTGNNTAANEAVTWSGITGPAGQFIDPARTVVDEPLGLSYDDLPSRSAIEETELD